MGSCSGLSSCIGVVARVSNSCTVRVRVRVRVRVGLKVRVRVRFAR